MARFLVVDFDRYDTHKSEHHFIEGDEYKTHMDALAWFTNENVDGFEYYKNHYTQTDEVFGSCAFEESDLLIYKLT